MSVIFLKEAKTNCVIYYLYSSLLEPTKFNLKEFISGENIKGEKVRGNQIPFYNTLILMIMNTFLWQ